MTPHLIDDWSPCLVRRTVPAAEPWGAAGHCGARPEQSKAPGIVDCTWSIGRRLGSGTASQHLERFRAPAFLCGSCKQAAALRGSSSFRSLSAQARLQWGYGSQAADTRGFARAARAAASRPITRPSARGRDAGQRGGRLVLNWAWPVPSFVVGAGAGALSCRAAG